MKLTLFLLPSLLLACSLLGNTVAICAPEPHLRDTLGTSLFFHLTGFYRWDPAEIGSSTDQVWDAPISSGNDAKEGDKIKHAFVAIPPYGETQHVNI